MFGLNQKLIDARKQSTLAGGDSLSRTSESNRSQMFFEIDVFKNFFNKIPFLMKSLY